jgi:hypothetical protein
MKTTAHVPGWLASSPSWRLCRFAADFADHREIDSTPSTASRPRRAAALEGDGHESYLTDVAGPRLTGSPEHQGSGDWAEKP